MKIYPGEHVRKENEWSHHTDGLKCPLITTKTLLGLVDSNKCFGVTNFNPDLFL